MAISTRRVSSVVGARVLGPDGSFVSRDSVGISEGRFSFESETAGDAFDGSGLWMIPGVYDCHTHIAWSDFHAKDRESRPAEERRTQTIAALEATLAAGVVGARDAGGADAELKHALARGELRGPRLQISVDMLGPELAGDSKRLRAAVELALDRGAQWIKLIATESVGHVSGTALSSHFTEDEFRLVVDAASQRGGRVMVHAWGGPAITWAIDAGVTSVEHGIFLTAEQASLAASRQVTFVPTLTVYHYVQEMVSNGTLPGVSSNRIAEVLVAHEVALRVARDAGVRIALGSDFGTAQQHGRNLVEIASLIRAGLSPAEALFAATRNGAQLLEVTDGGQIRDGYLADAVLLSADPNDPTTYEDASSVAAVLIGGELIVRQPDDNLHTRGAQHND